ncbi:family 78 glycoside hydrolase catalytic domain [Blautia producta]|uniref:alpha-L-rhamnosidase n=1 Tax=Blautia producta TaxID=33035 RepID=A0A4P6LUC1_9FIRM|nr:family 78 glycoside hydrolase catalytic domain [Blautia producta]QBE95492.1 hypothetical protein PMF13cell1_01015 [Blautia producta]
MNKLWKQWITNHTKKPFYARKEFDVKNKVEKAVVKICGLGQFELHLNGKKVGDHELDPAWTEYRKMVQYVTFDVTDVLRQGRNVIGAEVGNGWFHLDDSEGYSFKFPEFMPPNPNPYHAYGEHLVLGLVLEIMYSNGTRELIETDTTWKTISHEVISSNVYGSELIDQNLCQKNWDSCEFDDSSWNQAKAASNEDIPEGKLLEQTMPPVKVIHSYEAKHCGKPSGSTETEIYDLSQNCSFMLSFEVKGRKGDIVKFYPAEKLNSQGDVDQFAKGWTMVNNCITFIVGTDQEWEKYRQKFSYSAGRYIRIECSNPGIEIRNVYGHAISSAWEEAGSFYSDDRRYKQIYDLVEKAVEANMVGVHTDCPTIERFAWQEPNHLMAPAIFYMKNGKELWRKFLMDMRISQHTTEDIFYDFDGNVIYPGEGLMPSQCPCYIPNVIPVPGMGSFYDIIAWGSTCILGTRWHYIFYGDQSIIEENYEAGKRYFSHLMTMVNEDGFINHGLGDWGNPENELGRENIETAFLYADAKTLSWFASILGNKEDELKYREEADLIEENYNKHLLVRNENGKWCYRNYEHQDRIVMTQACEALPLYWGMVPEECKEDVVEVFRQTLCEKKAFVTGEVGLPYVIQTAAEYGMNDLIAQFITREQHPSYYAFVLDGLTTLGEYWEENPRSQCHDMMGHITEWFYNGIAGIQPLEPGFKKVLIKPYLPSSMNEVKATYHSACGKIEVELHRTSSEVAVQVCTDDGILVTIDKSNL